MSNSIYFEGALLPPAIYWLELLTYIVPSASAELRDWTLDLHYSWGRTRSCDSQIVIKSVNEARILLEQNQDSVQRELKMRLPDEDPEILVNEWKQGLQIIEEIAGSCPRCSWTMPVSGEEGERAAVRAGETLIFLIDNMAKAQDVRGSDLWEIEKLKEKIENANGATKLNLINAALDVLNGKRSNS